MLTTKPCQANLPAILQSEPNDLHLDPIPAKHKLRRYDSEK